ncbi:hypothetical protein FKM82_017294 [Ascaphus truei]
MLMGVDLSTQDPEAVTLATINARAGAEALLEVFPRVGCPSEILTDQGSQFRRGLLQGLWGTSTPSLITPRQTVYVRGSMGP